MLQYKLIQLSVFWLLFILFWPPGCLKPFLCPLLALSAPEVLVTLWKHIKQSDTVTDAADAVVSAVVGLSWTSRQTVTLPWSRTREELSAPILLISKVCVLQGKRGGCVPVQLGGLRRPAVFFWATWMQTGIVVFSGVHGSHEGKLSSRSNPHPRFPPPYFSEFGLIFNRERIVFSTNGMETTGQLL